MISATEIRKILEDKYDRKVWRNFLSTHFTNNKMYVQEQEIRISDNVLSENCVSLGNYEVDDYTKIGIYEIQLKKNVNIARNRVALRNLLKDITRQVSGAMVVFVQGDKWRFSYISKRKVRKADSNEIVDKETAPKRYTYLFGKGEKALTASTRFEKLINKQQSNMFDLLSLEDFEEAFNVDKLGKEFFKNYKGIYEEFVLFLTGKKIIKKANKFVEEKIQEPNAQLQTLFHNDEKQARDFVKRMLGRIVFLYFIQKKGWLAVEKGKKWGEGNPDFIYNLFRRAKKESSFYSKHLVPLFFDTLNNTESENPENELRFPYLNGGLFDNAQDEGYNSLQLPYDIFDKLFETFNQYNFTVYEDLPDEHTVAVDPEMLGHIFENLLEDNKDKGAFYTPKEIVHFMCKESLKAYLLSHDDLKDSTEETIDNIIQQKELTEEELKWTTKNAYKIQDALENVKICDPAIGSGAFPMGLLQEIFNTQIYLQEMKGFKKSDTDAQIKKHIIEESIYGVDIDEGAVDIARLRFWLSLVVDEEKPHPLPNLDFKIICANSLISLGSLADNLYLHEIEIGYKKIRDKFFDASHNDKIKLEKEFSDLQNQLKDLREFASKNQMLVIDKLLEFNPFGDSSCSWFDPWWMFGITQGFDIIIGNPPYVQMLKNQGKLSKLYETENYKTFSRTGDIYSLFYEKGINLLKPNAHLIFITSNKWMRASYGESLRGFFSDYNPVLLLDLGPDIFDSATVDTNILLIQNKKNCLNTKAGTISKFDKEDFITNINSLINLTDFNTSESWIILSEIERSIKQKIEKVGIPLKDWDINIYRGILTGFNEAFIIDGKKREELILEDPKSAEIIHPILRGRDIKRYSYEFADLFLINSHNGIKEKGILPVNVEDYPSIKNHLNKYFVHLEKRADKGDTPYNLRNCAYIEDFFKQKVVWKAVGKNLTFSIVESGKFVTAPACFLTCDNVNYVLAFLSSKIIKYFILNNSDTTGAGDIMLNIQSISNIPIPKKISSKQNLKIENLLEKIFISINEEKNYTLIERELNNIFFEIYQLNTEEIKFIDSFLSN